MNHWVSQVCEHVRFSRTNRLRPAAIVSEKGVAVTENNVTQIQEINRQCIVSLIGFLCYYHVY